MAKKQQKPREAKTRDEVKTGEVMPAEPVQTDDPTVAMVEVDKPTILSFLMNLGGFMRRANELEQAALDLEARVKREKDTPLTSGEEDAKIQLRIKTSNAAKKTAEEHWNICAVLSQLHRKTTGKRGITVNALENAARYDQNRHNLWLENDRRRVEREQALERRQAEARERERQETEARLAEAKALEAEAAMPTLSERELMFVDYVTGPYGPSRAAQMAGYKDAEKSAERLMAAPKIQQAIEAKKQAKAAREQAQAIREQPLDVQVHSNVTRDVKKMGTDRTYKRGEILDEGKLIEACIAGSYGIPHDVLMINPAKVNQYARDLGSLINKWPGVRYVEDTKTV